MSTPLDPGKAAFYGQFVAAAYDMYAVNNDDLRPAPTHIPPGWELSAWINMSDFLFQIKAPKFYGIVVHETLTTGIETILKSLLTNDAVWSDHNFIKFNRIWIIRSFCWAPVGGS